MAKRQLRLAWLPGDPPWFLCSTVPVRLNTQEAEKLALWLRRRSRVESVLIKEYPEDPDPDALYLRVMLRNRYVVGEPNSLAEIVDGLAQQLKIKISRIVYMVNGDTTTTREQWLQGP
jgi:alkanesulfonate monooxygenase SsuD/methylene tetrahydromethanopterin reductase-like flavin-dependent oxidoreductase (luciferase family)